MDDLAEVLVVEEETWTQKQPGRDQAADSRGSSARTVTDVMREQKDWHF